MLTFNVARSLLQRRLSLASARYRKRPCNDLATLRASIRSLTALGSVLSGGLVAVQGYPFLSLA